MTTTPTTPMASDAEIADRVYGCSLDYDDDRDVIMNYGELRRILNRLAASEARCAEVTAERDALKGLNTTAVVASGDGSLAGSSGDAVRLGVSENPERGGSDIFGGLKAAQAKVGESDRECAERVMLEDDEKWDSPDPIAEIIAAHVAAQVAPIQKRLDEAVVLIKEALKTDYEPLSWDRRARALLRPSMPVDPLGRMDVNAVVNTPPTGEGEKNGTV